MLEARTYTVSDKARCLSIFRSNVPKFFESNELIDYEKFLDNLPCDYLVVHDHEKVLGCGGYDVDKDSGDCRLSWGMIDAHHHRKRIGQFLLLIRLRLISEDSAARRVLMNTSQYSSGFFEKFGFTVIKNTPDGLAPGLDRLDLELILTDAIRTSLAEA